MDAGRYTFVLNIPPNFQRDVLAGRTAEVQLNVDATRMSQAFSGNAYVQQIVMAEVTEFVQRYRGSQALPVSWRCACALTRCRKTWFGSSRSDQQRHHALHHLTARR